MYFIFNVCYIPFIPLSSKSSAFFQFFRGRNGRNEFLPLSSTRPEESHFFRKKLNPVRNTSIKIARVIGILRKLKRIFPRHILRLIYNSLIHPHLLYGLSLWGFKQKRITVLQKKSCKNYCISTLYISFHFSF